MIIICINLFSAKKGTHIYTTITLQFPFNCRRHNLFTKCDYYSRTIKSRQVIFEYQVCNGYLLCINRILGINVERVWTKHSTRVTPHNYLLYYYCLFMYFGTKWAAASNAHRFPSNRLMSDPTIDHAETITTLESFLLRPIASLVGRDRSNCDVNENFSSHQSTSKGIRAHPSTFHSLFI